MSIIVNKKLNRKNQVGITLVEVLVALLVLSIGLVGLAALQVNGLRLNHSAYLRTQSTVLAYDIIDSMRANRDQARAGGYLLGIGVNKAAKDCSGGCTPSELAQSELADWEANLAARLPQGNGSVTSLAIGATRVVKVTVQWQENRGDITGTQELTVDAEI